MKATVISAGRSSPTGSRMETTSLAGKLGEREAREATVRATRRLARRQRAWFRRDPRIHWLRADRKDLLTEALRLAAPTIEV